MSAGDDLSLVLRDIDRAAGQLCLMIEQRRISRRRLSWIADELARSSGEIRQVLTLSKSKS